MGGYYGIAALAAMMQLALALAFAFVLVVAAADGSDDGGAVVGLPNCPTKCGDVSVPYPFGIQPECYLEGFNLTCTPPQLHLPSVALHITNISLDDSTLRLGSSSPLADIAMLPRGLNYFEQQLVLRWKVVSTVLQALNETRAGNLTCPRDLGSTSCHSSYSTCRTSTRSHPNEPVGYICSCDEGYQGNAYLADGCRGKLPFAPKPCVVSPPPRM
jgi:hypothetical protein